jgi:dipeptidyl aminopeptidase/acylaminoacyl peptidase
VLAPVLDVTALGLTAAKPIYYTGSALASMVPVTFADTGVIFRIASPAPADRPLVVQGAPGQSGNLQEWQNSGGASLARVDSQGRFVGDGSLLTNLPLPPPPPPLPTTIAYTDLANTFTVGPQTINTGAAATVGLVVKGAVSQTANLQTWQNSASAVRAAVLPDGGFYAAGAFTENTTTAGAYLGVTGGSTRLMLANGTAADNYQMDVQAGGFRWLYPGVVFIQGYRVNGSIQTTQDFLFGGNDGAAALPCRVWARSNVSSKPVVIIGQDFSGAATAPALRIDRLSSTSTRREVIGIDSSWVDSTDASRKGRAVFTVYDTAAREFMRADGTGTAAAIGFLGAAAIARPIVSGSRGGNAALASLLTALATLGLITDSTTA